MKRWFAAGLALAFVLGLVALFAPAEAKGPTPCPLIACGPCQELVKVKGEKCPVCQDIPGCIP
jgi:hypothetical protein